MAKIKLSAGGFTLIPEGTHTFKVSAVSYNEDFGKLEITLETATGLKHVERFRLLKDDGSENQGALNAFSYFAKIALDDFAKQEIDPQELVGHFLECDVTHDIMPSTREAGKTVTFVRLGDKRPSRGWPVESAPKAKGKPDLKALLG